MNTPSTNTGLEPGLREGIDVLCPNARLSLVRYPDHVLRTVCQPVETFDSTLRDLADEMMALMQHYQGIGLAAPQVGLRQRLMVSCIEDHPLVLANPEVKDSTEPRDFVEGCLSLPGVRINVRRPERIRVTGYDVQGQRRSFGAVGLWARVIQHELDHLNGVLICDYNSREMETCQHCRLELPAKLIDQRKHQSRPPRRA
jgi:peptide deformylase